MVVMADSGGIANKIDRYFNFNREMPKLSTEVRSHTGGGARKGGGPATSSGGC